MTSPFDQPVVMQPKPELPSLITTNAADGLALAGQIAAQILDELVTATETVELPGGTHLLLPPALPRELVTSVVFYTIAAANRGWPANP
jgi:hypothetical protein